MLFTTPTGATLVDGAVSASALVTTSSGQMTVVLKSLLVNAKSDGQAVSGFEFDFVQAIGGTTTMASDTGTTVSISGGVGTPDSTVISAGWAFGTFNSEFLMCIICGSSGLTPPYHTAPPSHLILGPGPYSNSNASLENHSPFMDQTVTFTINNPNITSSTQVADVFFRFSTTFADSEEEPGQFSSTTPEPGTLGLAVIPALLLVVGARKKFARI
jgi:hypothetical protein